MRLILIILITSYSVIRWKRYESTRALCTSAHSVVEKKTTARRTRKNVLVFDFEEIHSTVETHALSSVIIQLAMKRANCVESGEITLWLSSLETVITSANCFISPDRFQRSIDFVHGLKKIFPLSGRNTCWPPPPDLKTYNGNAPKQFLLYQFAVKVASNVTFCHVCPYVCLVVQPRSTYKL